MRTLGLLGGMSWESTLTYYRLINEGVRDRLGGLHSARLVLISVDFAPIEQLQRGGRWDDAGAALAGAAGSLAAAGAECVVLCTNTMHKVAPAIEAAVPIPLLHIADATGDAVVAAGVMKIGLLGTRFTMEESFYRDRLAGRYGLDVLVPGPADRGELDRVIFDELCLGHVVDASRTRYRDVMRRLVADGAEAIVLGCTEISLLVGPDDASVPLFDTTALHAAAAVTWTLERS
jgi:aspartate racemase